MEKMTNKKALEFVLGLEEVKANVEICDKLQKMLIQVEKKNSSVNKKGEKVLTPDQKVNEVYKAHMLEEMVGKEPMQAKDMAKTFACFAGKDITPQKVSALLKQLVTDGKVVRIEDKRITKFALADNTIEEIDEIEEEVTE